MLREVFVITLQQMKQRVIIVWCEIFSKHGCYIN